jgi:hypothetical protein
MYLIDTFFLNEEGLLRRKRSAFLVPRFILLLKLRTQIGVWLYIRAHTTILPDETDEG